MTMTDTFILRAWVGGLIASAAWRNATICLDAIFMHFVNATPYIGHEWPFLQESVR